MQDPSPENIMGQKVRQHSFEHRIRWDLLVSALVAGYVVWKLLGGFGTSSPDDEQDADRFGPEIEDAAEVLIE